MCKHNLNNNCKNWNSLQNTLCLSLPLLQVPEDPRVCFHKVPVDQHQLKKEGGGPSVWWKGILLNQPACLLQLPAKKTQCNLPLMLCSPLCSQS